MDNKLLAKFQEKLNESVLKHVKKLGTPRKVFIRTYDDMFNPVTLPAIGFSTGVPGELDIVISIDDFMRIGLKQEDINSIFGENVFDTLVPPSEAIN